MTSISREPGDYELTIHARQRRRDRNVPLDAIAECISDGEVTEDIENGGGEGVVLKTKWGAITYWAAINPGDEKVASCGVVGGT